MMLTFDASVPLHIQLIRSARRKQKGRKHMHTIGPTRKQTRRKNPNTAKVKNARAYKHAVAAYWRGERDTHPLPL